MSDEIELEMSDLLQQAVDFAFKEAEEKLVQGGELMPFTVLAEEENLYVETHPGETIEECVESAHKTVRIASDAITAYVFCYDGYADLDDGRHDAAIVECAERGAGKGMVLCKLYNTTEDGTIEFDEQEYFLDSMEPYFGEPREKAEEIEEAEDGESIDDDDEDADDDDIEADEESGADDEEDDL